MGNGPSHRPWIGQKGGCESLLDDAGNLPAGVFCDGEPSDRSAFFTVFGFYVAVLLGISFYSFQREQAADDKYLFHFFGGKSYSPVVLFMSLFSTIFSAYTVVGVPNEAAYAGFFSLRWLTSAVLIGLASLILTPRGYRVNADRNYLSPNDFIGDRFNNRLLSLTTSLLSASSVLLYIVTQFYTMNELMQYLSNGSYDANAATWCLAAVIWVAEALGGFDATTMTDTFQSGIMIVSFIVVAILMAETYGAGAGAADSVEAGCSNAHVLDCSQAPLGPYSETGNKCADNCYNVGDIGAYSSGCTADTNSWYALHPAVGWSEYFQPLRRFRGNVDTWLSSPSNNQSGLYANEEAAATRVDNTGCDSLKIDSSNSYNHMPVKMLSWNILTMAYILNPHWQTRSMAAKNDHTVKWANVVLAGITVLTSLPGILIGITAGANLAAVNPFGGPAFSWVLGDLMNRGGFSEFVGVVAGVSAMAAMMSTIDSAIISVTNLITREWLMNWLMYDPDRSVERGGARGVASGDSDLKAGKMLYISKAISFVVVVLTVCIALYEEDLKNDPDVYGNLFAWSSAILWQVLPASVLGLYFDRVSGFGCILGIISGLATLIGMFVYVDNQKFFGSIFSFESDSVDYTSEACKTDGTGKCVWGTDFDPEESATKTFYLEYYLWSGLANLAVVLLTMPLNLPDTIPALEMDCIKQYHNSRLGGNKKITAAAIREKMSSNGGVEPIRSPVGRTLMVVCFVMANLCLPFWGDSYDNCDVFSMAAWQTAEKNPGAPTLPQGFDSGYFATSNVPCGAALVLGTGTNFTQINPNAVTPNALTGNPAYVVCGGLQQYGAAAAADAAAAATADSGSGTAAGPSLEQQAGALLARASNLIFGGSVSPATPADLGNAFATRILTNNVKGNGKTCNGYTLVNGLPQWAVVIIACYIVCIFCNIGAYSLWTTIDDPDQTSSWKVDETEEVPMDNVADSTAPEGKAVPGKITGV